MVAIIFILLILACAAFINMLDEVSGKRAKRDAVKAEEAVRREADRKVRITEQEAQAAQAQPDELEQLRLKVKEQEGIMVFMLDEIGRLQGELGQRDATIAGRDATIADLTAQLERVTSTTAAQPESQFRKLRALIVKELHPDHAPAGSVDRAIRAEVFKAIWPKIEAIVGRA